MFKDKVTTKLKAGKGGNGIVAYNVGRVPYGGSGGNGGDVYIEGSVKIYDLSFINNDSEYSAEAGAKGEVKNLQGKDGKDLIFKVPLITNVYDMGGELIASLKEDGQRIKLLSGGKGGLGNYMFRRGVENHGKHTDGEVGDELKVKLELELYSDVIFIGFPNAGKSSILNAITNAQSEVASYAFTTLNPQLGRLDKLVLMDLPGLIEGTYEGKGLGTKFVKHTRHAKYVAHLLSLESENPVDEYKRMRGELKNIDKDLFDKPEFIVLTKSDLVDPKKVTQVQKDLKKFKKEVLLTSVYDYDALENLKIFLKSKLS